ncbi:MAG TPA: peptidase S41 [Lutibacter sp.]|nr:peptidase S41 [Lutibacter sp.]
MKKTIIYLLLLLISFPIYSQNCDCSSNLKWLIETFEKNDAGFHYVIEQKGRNAYELHNKIIMQKLSKISTLKECHQLLIEWTEFFRKGHLGVNLLATDTKKSFGTETFNINQTHFQKRIENLKNKTGYEGIWVSSPYTIGIVKDDKNVNRDYIGFIINSGNPNWKVNQVKLEIIKNKDGKYSMKYYMGDHSLRTIKDVKIEGEIYMIADFISLKKIKPEIKFSEPDKELFYKSVYADKPFIEKIRDNVVLLRIPSFMYENKKEIDSLLSKNDSLIKKTTNLIIDLRNNGGGSDASYGKIIPYLYTNPYRVIGVERLSTELNNVNLIKYFTRPDLPKNEIEWAKESIEKINNNIGKFVNLDSEIDINTRDEIFPFPKNVAILINENCGSTTEQFLLAAKQSKKVKLFGITTAGALDISNLNSIKSLCNEFELVYGTSKSIRIPEMIIDDKGIQPDYYFDKSIKPYEWIDKTIEILNYE